MTVNWASESELDWAKVPRLLFTTISTSAEVWPVTIARVGGSDGTGVASASSDTDCHVIGATVIAERPINNRQASIPTRLIHLPCI